MKRKNHFYEDFEPQPKRILLEEELQNSSEQDNQKEAKDVEEIAPELEVIYVDEGSEQIIVIDNTDDSSEGSEVSSSDNNTSEEEFEESDKESSNEDDEKLGFHRGRGGKGAKIFRHMDYNNYSSSSSDEEEEDSDEPVVYRRTGAMGFKTFKINRFNNINGEDKPKGCIFKEHGDCKENCDIIFVVGTPEEQAWHINEMIRLGPKYKTTFQLLQEQGKLNFKW